MKNLPFGFGGACMILAILFAGSFVIGFPLYMENKAAAERYKYDFYNEWVGREVNIGLNERGIIDTFCNSNNKMHRMFVVRYKNPKKQSLVSASASLISGRTDDVFLTRSINVEVIARLNPELERK